MALAKEYGRRVTKCVLTATRTSELKVIKTGTSFCQIFCQISETRQLKKIKEF